MFRTRFLIKYCLTTQELNPKQCYYKSLGISTNADIDTIRRAYLDMVKKYHPDLNKHADTTDIFTTIKKAYEILSEEESKAEYDSKKQYNASHTKVADLKQADETMQRIKMKFMKGEENRRKDLLNDEFNFSYKLYKTHFDKIQKNKPTYNKFNDMDGHYYEPKNYNGPSLFKSFMFLLLPAGGLLGYFMFYKL